MPVAVPDEDRVYYQEIDFVATRERLVSVSKTPPGETAFDPNPAKEACRPDDRVGMFVAHLVENIAERYLDLVDDLDDEIDELEEKVEREPGRRSSGDACASSAATCGRSAERSRPPETRCTRCSTAASSSTTTGRTARRTLPRDVEIAFSDAYDKLLRATEALESSRDSLGGVRDYLQGTIANDQNEVVKRLTVVASLLLVPTFIVGLYGQNFRTCPSCTGAGATGGRGPDHRHDGRAARVLPLEALDLNSHAGPSDPQTFAELVGVGEESLGELVRRSKRVPARSCVGRCRGEV